MRSIRSALHRTVYLLAAAALLLGQPRAHGADAATALQQAPAGAQVVIAIPDLAELNSRVAALRTAIGVDAADMDDVVGRMKTQMGMTDGVDDSGAMLIVIPDVTKADPAGGGPAVLMLVPVSDYAAFLGNYEAEAAEGVTEFAMPGMRQAFAKQAEGHAVLSAQRELVEAYAPAGEATDMLARLGQLGADAAGASDVLICFDIAALEPIATPAIDQAVQQMHAMIDMTTPDQESAASMKLTYTLYGQFAKAVMRDGDAGVIGVGFTDSGVTLREAIRFTEDSKLAGLMTGQPGEDGTASLLAALPEKRYIFAMAMDARVVDMAGIVDAVLEAMPEEGGDMVAMYRESLPLAKQMTGVAGALYVPPPGGMSLFSGINIYRTDDTGAFVEQYRKTLDAVNGVSVPMGMMGQATYATSYTPNELELEGVAVDRYSLTLQMPAEAMQGPMGMLMGASSYEGYIAVKEGAVVQTLTADPQLITSALRAVDQGAGIGTGPMLTDLRAAALPQPLLFEGYLSLDGIAEMANPLLMLIFGGQQINVPQGVQPVAMGAATEGGGLLLQVHVPHSASRFVVDTVEQLQGLGAGPGGPGGPEGFGGPPPGYEY